MNSELLIPVLSGTILFALLVTFIIYFVVLYRKSQDKFLLEQEQLKQALLRAEVEIKEQTLVDISRELHDNFGQIASLIKINLNLLSKGMNSSQLTKIEETKGLVQELISDFKQLSNSLNGDRIEQIGFTQMLQSEIERINRMDVVKVEGVIPELHGIQLKHSSKVLLFRVLQEAINNTLKHSGATKAELNLSVSNEILSVRYWDNGKGFITSNLDNLTGSGIRNMEARCKMIGASFKLQGQTGKGVELFVDVNIGRQ